VATKVIVCPECSQLVAYGRLSCPSCGALLASVVGGEREERPTVVPGLNEPPRLIPDDEPATRPARVVARADEGPEVAADWADEGPFQSRQADPVATPDRTPGGSGQRALNPSAVGAVGRRGPKPIKPGQASLLADLPFDAPGSLGGWLVAIGAGLALVGLLLPWADPVILGRAGGGYFATWGLAGPGHGFAFVAALLTFALAILPTPVPAWIRDRVVAPILAGVLLGLVWPYLLGPIQFQLGVLMSAAAAIVMAAGVVVVQRPAAPPRVGRHEGEAPPV
jgi:hypothetical protein